MLGKAAIVLEGLTEFHALPVAARRIEESLGAFGYQPLDILGATFLCVWRIKRAEVWQVFQDAGAQDLRVL